MRAASEKGLDFTRREFFLSYIFVFCEDQLHLSRPSSTGTKGVKFTLRFLFGYVLNSQGPTPLHCLGK